MTDQEPDKQAKERMMDMYDPLSHDFQGTSSVGKHTSCVLCGGNELEHKNEDKVVKQRMLREMIQVSAQAYCENRNKHKQMDVLLITDICDALIRAGWRKV